MAQPCLKVKNPYGKNLSNLEITLISTSRKIVLRQVVTSIPFAAPSWNVIKEMAYLFRTFRSIHADSH
jgi:hypothetical protein